MPSPGKPWRWSLALLVTMLALVAWLTILLQFWFMHPFKAQTPAGLSIAAFLRDAAPIMALACLVLVLAASAMLWGKARTVARVMLVGAGLVTLAATLVARLNAFERMFAPMRSL